MTSPDDQSTPTQGSGQAAAQSAPSGSPGERIQGIIEAAEKAAAGIIEDADAQARRYIDASRKRADDLADERVRVMSELTDTLVRQAEIVRRQSDELLSALDSARNELASRIGKELSLAAGSTPPAQVGAGPQAAPAAKAAEPEKAEEEPQGQQPAAQGQAAPHLKPVESKRPDLQAVPTQEQPAAEPANRKEEKEEGKQGAQAPARPASQPPPPPPPPPAQPIGSGGSGKSQGNPSDGARLLAAQMAVAGSSRQEIESRLKSEFGIEDAAPILDGILGPG